MSTLVRAHTGAHAGFNFTGNMVAMPDGSVLFVWGTGDSTGSSGEQNTNMHLWSCKLTPGSGGWTIGTPASWPVDTMDGSEYRLASFIRDGSRVWAIVQGWGLGLNGSDHMDHVYVAHTDDSGTTWTTSGDMQACPLGALAITSNATGKLPDGSFVALGHYSDGTIFQVRAARCVGSPANAGDWTRHDSGNSTMAEVEPTFALDSAGTGLIVMARCDAFSPQYLIQRTYDLATNMFSAAAVNTRWSQNCPAALLRDQQGALWLFRDTAPTRAGLTAETSTNDGATWPAATPIASGDAQYPAACQADDGTVWAQWSASKQDIYIQNMGVFAGSTPPPDTPHMSTNAALTAVATGDRVHLAWNDDAVGEAGWYVERRRIVSSSLAVTAGASTSINGANSPVWATLRASATGASATNNGDVAAYSELYSAYYARREWLRFDTSGWPAGQALGSATFKLTQHTKTGSGQGLYLVTTDITSSPPKESFDQSHFGGASPVNLADAMLVGTGSDGSTTTVNLTAAGLALVNLSGYTYFGLRCEKDFLNSAPSGSNYAYFYGPTAAAGNRPTLTLYGVDGSPYLLNAQQAA